MSEKTGIDQLCVPQNLVRSNYYSDTYRAELKVGSETGIWDIIHISLPFAPLRERKAMVRFGLEKSEMMEYYRAFGKCVKNDLSIVNFLADAEVKSVVRYVSFIRESKDSGVGSDVYLITRPMELFVEKYHWAEGETTNLLTVLNFAARMLQINKGVTQVQTNFGILDMDSIYMMTDGDKELVTLGGLQYGCQAQSDYVTLPKGVPAHCHPSLLAGGRPSVATDTWSLCSLLWAILDGRHYTATPDFTKAPQYAPDQLISVLKAGLRCAEEGSAESLTVTETVKQINKDIRALMKQITSGAIPNTEILMGEPEFDLNEAVRSYRADPISAAAEEERALAAAKAAEEPEPFKAAPEDEESPPEVILPETKSAKQDEEDQPVEEIPVREELHRQDTDGPKEPRKSPPRILLAAIVIVTAGILVYLTVTGKL